MKWSATLVIQLVFAVVMIGGATVVRGMPGFLGAILGVVVVVLFFGSTKVIIGPIATMSPAMSQPLALLFFLTKAGALAALLVLVLGSDSASESLDFTTLSLTLIIGAVLWIIAQTIDHMRERIPTYDLPESKDSGTDTMDER